MIDRRRALMVRRAGLLQTEIELNDVITVGYKQMLVNVLCERYEKTPATCMRVMNKHAKTIIYPKIPHTLKYYRYKYPHLFIKGVGFPFTFTDDEGKERIVILSPDVMMYFSPEEMNNIMIKAQYDEVDRYRERYDKTVAAAIRYIKAKNKLREVQIEYATMLNTPRFNTYKQMLKSRPDFFEKLYKAITGFDLLEKYKDAQL